MALPTTLDLDESGWLSLPFILSDPATELLQRPVRNLDAINYIRVETWKSLRISKLKSKSPPPGALSILPRMHLEIVLEILGYLHPLELLQISRTSKAFHELLRFAITDLTWRNSFMVEDHPKTRADLRLPRCPSQLSGRRWAKLLFGPKICEECCQCKSSADVDYMLLRRVCDTCVEANLLDTLPGYSASHELYSMIPRTKRVAPVRNHRRFSWDRFWRGDGAAIASQYEVHVTSAGGSEAEAVRSFVREQKALVGKQRYLTARGQNWEQHTLYKYSREYDTMLNKVRISAEERLDAEGFDDNDFWTLRRAIGACEALCRKPRLTTRLWTRARPHIVPHVVEAQINRLACERTARIELRKKAALMALRTPVPGSRNTYYLPPHCTIDAFPPIAQLVNEDPAEASGARRSPARRRVVLLPSPGPGSEHNLQPGLHSLQRATSVFKVQLSYIYNYRRHIFIGWDGARAWCHRREGDVEFDPQGSMAAAALAVLLGLDPETVTAAEMDEANARFLCGTCPPESKGQRRARGWRYCVFHASSSDAATHSATNWLLLSPAAAADVRRREEPDDYSVLCVWSCTLCTLFIPSLLQTQSSVRDHLRAKHKIADPAEGDHFIRFLGPQIPRRRRVMLYVDAAHPPRYRCRRCPPHVVKLFPLRALRLHVRDRHLVEFSDDDYTEFDLLSTPDFAVP
ncbi:hypothetical protein C8J57DRAFT_1715798 [Mycena rebaudengoi]|nr:hypothetical protein C8J57DRAFT_1715798 [Mycena rebaudengoi]